MMMINQELEATAQSDSHSLYSNEAKPYPQQQSQKAMAKSTAYVKSVGERERRRDPLKQEKGA